MSKDLLKISGYIAIVSGIIACITVFGAIVGIPVIIGGNKLKKYSELSDTEVLTKEESILIWSIVLILLCTISGVLALIFYIEMTEYKKGNSIGKKTNPQNVNNDKYEQLEKVKKLYDEKILTKEEFEKEKNRILNQ